MVKVGCLKHRPEAEYKTWGGGQKSITFYLYKLLQRLQQICRIGVDEPYKTNQTQT